MHEQIRECVNSYLLDCLTHMQIADYINLIEMVPVENCGDWRDYVPMNLRLCWRELTTDTRIGIALMAMGTEVGAIGRPPLARDEKGKETCP